MKIISIFLVFWLLTSSLSASKADSLKIEPQITILEFGADDCYYCQKMRKILFKTQFEYVKSVKVEFIDFNNFRNYRIINKYFIKEIPSQIFLDKDQKVFFRHTGFLTEKNIWKIIEDELQDD